MPYFLVLEIPEPTSNVSPKKAGEQFEGWKVLLVSQNNTAWFICQVTGYPVPRFM